MYDNPKMSLFKSRGWWLYCSSAFRRRFLPISENGCYPIFEVFFVKLNVMWSSTICSICSCSPSARPITPPTAGPAPAWGEVCSVNSEPICRDTWNSYSYTYTAYTVASKSLKWLIASLFLNQNTRDEFCESYQMPTNASSVMQQYYAQDAVRVFLAP